VRICILCTCVRVLRHTTGDAECILFALVLDALTYVRVCIVLLYMHVCMCVCVYTTYNGRPLGMDTDMLVFAGVPGPPLRVSSSSEPIVPRSLFDVVQSRERGARRCGAKVKAMCVLLYVRSLFDVVQSRERGTRRCGAKVNAMRVLLYVRTYAHVREYFIVVFRGCISYLVVCVVGLLVCLRMWGKECVFCCMYVRTPTCANIL